MGLMVLLNYRKILSIKAQNESVQPVCILTVTVCVCVSQWNSFQGRCGLHGLYGHNCSAESLEIWHEQYTAQKESMNTHRNNTILNSMYKSNMNPIWKYGAVDQSWMKPRKLICCIKREQNSLEKSNQYAIMSWHDVYKMFSESTTAFADFCQNSGKSLLCFPAVQLC